MHTFRLVLTSFYQLNVCNFGWKTNVLCSCDGGFPRCSRRETPYMAGRGSCLNCRFTVDFVAWLCQEWTTQSICYCTNLFRATQTHHHHHTMHLSCLFTAIYSHAALVRGCLCYLCRKTQLGGLQGLCSCTGEGRFNWHFQSMSWSPVHVIPSLMGSHQADLVFSLTFWDRRTNAHTALFHIQWHTDINWILPDWVTPWELTTCW